MLINLRKPELLKGYLYRLTQNWKEAKKCSKTKYCKRGKAIYLLIAAFYSLLVTSFLFLVTFWPVTLCFLLITCYFYSLVVAFYSLLVTFYLLPLLVTFYWLLLTFYWNFNRSLFAGRYISLYFENSSSYIICDTLQYDKEPMCLRKLCIKIRKKVIKFSSMTRENFDTS